MFTAFCASVRVRRGGKRQKPSAKPRPFHGDEDRTLAEAAPMVVSSAKPGINCATDVTDRPKSELGRGVRVRSSTDGDSG